MALNSILNKKKTDSSSKIILLQVKLFVLKKYLNMSISC